MYPNRRAGRHDTAEPPFCHIVRAVLMTEWLSHADVLRSIDVLRVWMSVGGCAKMTYGDECDVPSDYADTSAQICEHSEKELGAEADPLQLVLKKKVCLQAHQGFMFASDEDFQKVVNGAVAENLGTYHQRPEIHVWGSTHLGSNKFAKQLRCLVGVRCLQLCGYSRLFVGREAERTHRHRDLTSHNN